MLNDHLAAMQEAHDAAQAIHDLLKIAVPTNSADSVAIADATFAIDVLITGINAETFAARTGQILSNSSSLASGIKELEGLKAELNAIEARIASLANISSGIDALLERIKTAFPEGGLTLAAAEPDSWTAEFPITIVLSEDLSELQTRGLLTALSNYWRSCGGIGLSIESEYDEAKTRETANA